MIKPLKENEFRCYLCHKVFEKEWSDEKTLEEYEREFPDFKNEPREVVCDDCYEILMKDIKQ